MYTVFPANWQPSTLTVALQAIILELEAERTSWEAVETDLNRLAACLSLFLHNTTETLWTGAWTS